MIKLRIDVDYPYPSRVRSFIHTALNVQVGRNYLKNAKILARMINDSNEEVKAYWFFTPKTLPDNELLDMLPGVASGRLNVRTSKLGDALDILQYGLSVGKSFDEIQQELKETGLFESTACKE